MYSLLRSVAGSSSFSYSPNSSNCSSEESASVYADYLRSYFSVAQPKALLDRARSYLFELLPVIYPEKSHFFFCSPFSPIEFLVTAKNLPSSTATGPDKIAYFILKHLSRSNMNFSSTYFQSFLVFAFLFFHLEDFLSYSHPKMGKPLDAPASFLPISLTSCVSKFLNASFYLAYSFFLESNSTLTPRQADFRIRRSTLD